MTQINFNLHVLGWKAFEDLVACIFREVLGQTLQVFSAGPDGGRDAAFHGTWNGTSEFEGSFVLQCKHSTKPSKSLSLALVEDEFPKISRLAEKGLADNYLLITNYAIPAGIAEQVEERARNAGARQAKVFGEEWIGQVVAEKPQLRRLVPRLYGLGDLAQIVTSQAYAQSRQVLDSIAPDLSCFVPTDAYRKSAHALQAHGFVLLLGEPASGKTMIANLLALSAADEWNLQTLMVTSPNDFSRLWNPEDPGQFLWVDDAFGATQFDAGRVTEWNQQLPKLKAAIQGGARVVFTSRDYVFKAALRSLKVSSFDLFADSRVVIEVEKLTELERQMILYNHLKFGSQPRSFKSEVKPYLDLATEVEKFLPEIARRFAHPKFTTSLRRDESGVFSFFAEPRQVLVDVIASLADSEKAALALVFIAGGRLPIPLTSDPQMAETLDLMNATLGQVKQALSELDDSLLKRVREYDSEFWSFRHPTIRDAFATIIGANPELIDIYLAGVSTAQLITEVTCGDVGLEGVKIIVPSNKFGLIEDRLRVGQPSYQISSFLATRCSNAFLKEYFADPQRLESIVDNANASYRTNELRVLKILHLEGALPEVVRQQITGKMVNIANRDLDGRFLASVSVFFQPSELETGIQDVAVNALSRAESAIAEIKDEWNSKDDPAFLFYDLKGTLTIIDDNEDDLFSEEQQSEAAFWISEIERISAWMDESIQSKDYDTLDTERAIEAGESIERSIFDDVDE